MLPGREGDYVADADLERVVAAPVDAPTLEPEDFVRDEILEQMVQSVEHITATTTPPSAATPPSTATPPSAADWVFLELSSVVRGVAATALAPVSPILLLKTCRGGDRSMFSFNLPMF
jgi:hypothetical protein